MDGEVRRAQRAPAATAERYHVGAAGPVISDGSSPSAGGAFSLLAPVPLILGVGFALPFGSFICFVFSKTNFFLCLEKCRYPEASASGHGQLGLPASTLTTIGLRSCWPLSRVLGPS